MDNKTQIMRMLWSLLLWARRKSAGDQDCKRAAETCEQIMKLLREM